MDKSEKIGKDHTPLPWKYSQEMEINGDIKIMRWPIYTASGKFSHPAEAKSLEDAQFIVESVNRRPAYGRVVNLAKKRACHTEYCGIGETKGSDCTCELKEFKEALSELEEKENDSFIVESTNRRPAYEKLKEAAEKVVSHYGIVHRDMDAQTGIKSFGRILIQELKEALSALEGKGETNRKGEIK